MVLNLNRLIHHFQIDQSFDKKPKNRDRKIKIRNKGNFKNLKFQRKQVRI